MDRLHFAPLGRCKGSAYGKVLNLLVHKLDGPTTSWNNIKQVLWTDAWTWLNSAWIRISKCDRRRYVTFWDQFRIIVRVRQGEGGQWKKTKPHLISVLTLFCCLLSSTWARIYMTIAWCLWMFLSDELTTSLSTYQWAGQVWTVWTREVSPSAELSGGRYLRLIYWPFGLLHNDFYPDGSRWQVVWDEATSSANCDTQKAGSADAETSGETDVNEGTDGQVFQLSDVVPTVPSSWAQCFRLSSLHVHDSSAVR